MCLHSILQQAFLDWTLLGPARSGDPAECVPGAGHDGRPEAGGEAPELHAGAACAQDHQVNPCWFVCGIILLVAVPPAVSCCSLSIRVSSENNSACGLHNQCDSMHMQGLPCSLALPLLQG